MSGKGGGRQLRLGGVPTTSVLGSRTGENSGRLRHWKVAKVEKGNRRNVKPLGDAIQKRKTLDVDTNSTP